MLGPKQEKPNSVVSPDKMHPRLCLFTIRYIHTDVRTHLRFQKQFYFHPLRLHKNEKHKNSGDRCICNECMYHCGMTCAVMIKNKLIKKNKNKKNPTTMWIKLDL